MSLPAVLLLDLLVVACGIDVLRKVRARTKKRSHLEVLLHSIHLVYRRRRAGGWIPFHSRYRSRYSISQSKAEYKNYKSLIGDLVTAAVIVFVASATTFVSVVIDHLRDGRINPSSVYYWGVFGISAIYLLLAIRTLRKTRADYYRVQLQLGETLLSRHNLRLRAQDENVSLKLDRFAPLRVARSVEPPRELGFDTSPVQGEKMPEANAWELDIDKFITFVDETLKSPEDVEKLLDRRRKDYDTAWAQYKEKIQK